MKMHGLGDSAYWAITYLYFIVLSTVYLFFFVVFGSAIGLKFFRINNYLIQVVFYFVFANTQVAFSFLLSNFFGDVKTATVAGYLYVFGTGLLGNFLYQYFLEDKEFSSAVLNYMSLFSSSFFLEWFRMTLFIALSYFRSWHFLHGNDSSLLFVPWPLWVLPVLLHWWLLGPGWNDPEQPLRQWEWDPCCHWNSTGGVADIPPSLPLLGPSGGLR